MSALLPIVAAEIKATGPLSIARYMDVCLSHDPYGYYFKQDPFGAKGDFVTSPEISQMFGEMVGLWCVYVMQGLNAEGPINLVEFGPGRGTLMCDALRAAQSTPGFMDKVQVSLVETSPTLCALQKEQLKSFDVEVTWFDQFEDVPKGPLLVIGNEFFDALPIRQYVRGELGWFERLVGLKDDQSTLTFVRSENTIEKSLIPEVLLKQAKTDDVFEDQSLSKAVMEHVADRVVEFGGAALFVDYGHDQHGLGDTFQALRTHKFVDVLSNPGDQDLTAHVDFAQLVQAAKNAGAEVLGPLPQGVFLQSLGIGQRAATLTAEATEDQIFEVNRALSRLTNPEQMGSLFRVLAVSSKGLSVPPWSG